MASFLKKLWPSKGAKATTATTPEIEKAAIDFETIDIKALMGQAPDDVIDRFLKQSDLKIVVDNSRKEGVEVQTEPELSDEEDLVSEELAKIYLAQGLHEEAIAIYNKLILLNSEKSVYFAKIIEDIKNK